MRTSVEESSSSGSSSKEEGSSNNNNDDGPSWQQVANNDGSFLISVGEVVVSGRHVVESSSILHLNESSIEVFTSSIQEHAVLSILLSLVLVVVVFSQELSIGLALGWVVDWLIEHSHSLSSLGAGEERSVSVQPLVRGGLRVGRRNDLNNVGSISSGSSFSSISVGILITTNPLEVNVVVLVDGKVSGNKVVFSGRVGLDDVSSLSSNVQVVDTSLIRDIIGSRLDEEDMRSILEGSSVLGSIDSKLHGLSINGDNGILLDRRRSSIGRGVSEFTRGRIVNIGSRDIVSHSKDASVALLGDLGDSPIVRSSVSDSRSSISKVVLSGPGSLDAIGGSLTVGLNRLPVISSSLASSLVVLLSRASILLSAFVLVLNIEGLLLVGIAVVSSLSQDGNINPRGGMPIGIVISLFGTLESVSVSVVVLSGEDGGSSSSVEVAFLLSVSNEETKVSGSSLASLVELQRLVHSESVIVSSLLLNRGKIGLDSIGGASVSDVSRGIVSVVSSAHVLDNEVAVHSGISTTVLVGPLNGEERTFIKIHFRSLAVTTLSVVLGVEQSIGIVPVGVVLPEAIVGTSRVLHVQVTHASQDTQ